MLISKFTDCYMMTNSSSNIPYDFSSHVLGKYFRETGKRQGWYNGEHVNIALAVSGGGDSSALMWLFSKFYEGSLTAVHVNHGIRGSEADDDEKFTAKFAESLGVNFRSVKIDVPSLRMKGESLETSARRLRLKALIDTADELGITSVMLGHNRDDLAETVLFNILRGTGIRGSVGMTEKTVNNGVTFYRPLLGLRREFLRDILRVRGLTWREDSTNNDDSYTRNFIRLKLLPLIECGVNASAVEHLAQFGEDMREVRNIEDEKSLMLFTECSENESTFNRKILRSFSIDDIMLVMRLAGRNLGLRTLSRHRCIELAGLIRKGENFIFEWCGNVKVSGRNGKIFFEGVFVEQR